MLEVLEGSEGIGKFEPTHGGFQKNGRFRRYFLRYVEGLRWFQRYRRYGIMFWPYLEGLRRVPRLWRYWISACLKGCMAAWFWRLPIGSGKFWKCLDSFKEIDWLWRSKLKVLEGSGAEVPIGCHLAVADIYHLSVFSS